MAFTVHSSSTNPNPGLTPRSSASNPPVMQRSRKLTLEDLAQKLEIEEVEILHGNARQAEKSHQFLAGQFADNDEISPSQRALNEQYRQSQNTSRSERRKMSEILDSYTTYDKKKRAQNHTRYLAAFIEFVFSVGLLNLAIYSINTYGIQGSIEPLYYLILLILPHYLILQRVIKKYSHLS